MEEAEAAERWTNMKQQQVHNFLVPCLSFVLMGVNCSSSGAEQPHLPAPHRPFILSDKLGRTFNTWHLISPLLVWERFYEHLSIFILLWDKITFTPPACTCKQSSFKLTHLLYYEFGEYSILIGWRLSISFWEMDIYGDPPVLPLKQSVHCDKLMQLEIPKLNERKKRE